VRKKGKVQVIEPDEKAMLVVFNETTNTMKLFWQEKEIGTASFATDLDGDLAFGYLVQECKGKNRTMGKDSMDRKNKLNLKSSSIMFREWVTQIDNVLSKVETHKLDGSLLTKEDSAFHNARTVLAECAVQCKAAPAYVINEWVASDLIEDEIESRNAEMEKDER
jgi:hypothetical protein